MAENSEKPVYVDDISDIPSWTDGAEPVSDISNLGSVGNSPGRQTRSDDKISNTEGYAETCCTSGKSDSGPLQDITI